MIVPIDDILTLIHNNNIPDLHFIPIKNIINIHDKTSRVKLWDKGIEIPHAKMIEFQKKGIKEIDLLFSNLLYKSLTYHCKEHFRNPSAIKTFIEIDKIINTYENINKVSKRKRSISFMYELYSIKDENTPIVRFNEEINYQRWNSIKRFIKKNSKLPILYNEIGIIVFVDLSFNGDDNYIERFKKNADICSLLAQCKIDNTNFKFSSDFNSMTDIWAVNDPEELLNVYIEKKPRLIVVGEKINEIYKNALLEIKRYDKFARIIVATDINPTHRKSLLQKIKKAYNADNYTFE